MLRLRMVRSLLFLCLLPALYSGLPTPAGAQEATDPFLWLEDVEGSRAMEWVLARNAETRAALKALPDYERMYRNTLDLLTSGDRIAYPTMRGEWIYNFWTDAERPRGVYRRTSWDAYLSGNPTWETVLDVDALAEAEGQPWAFHGLNCLLPEERLCLVSLSPGGSDADEVREFDLERKAFVPGGFHVPVSKNSVAWVDENTLLVSHNLDEARNTTSGYSAAVRRWTRGTPLEQAPVIAEANRDDMAMWLGTQETADGARVMVMRFITIFDTEYRILDGERLVPIDIPSDAQLSMVGDRMVLHLISDWTVGGETFAAGSVVSTGLGDYLAGRRNIETVVVPGARSTINGVAATRDYLLINELTEVQGHLFRYWRDASQGWLKEEIPAPPMGSVGIGATSVHHNRFFFTYSSFIQPSTLYLAEEDGSVRTVKSLPAQFDAAGLIVEQFQAVSKDGTRVPYFVVHPRDMVLDGTNPTLQYGYGGFQISSTPSYLGAQGKGWVENGGVYVLANIRGGGEFGPDWWKAALKENRQRAYDDFIAVSEDLIARKITSPEHLGIMGGSNGGLLVGATMTQRPDLYNAVVIQVPLLDMRRYHTLLAGASWMAEYGDPDKPEEWEYIRKYSPYQNMKADVHYPKPFIFTTTRDDRVHPGHARKMAALMLSQGHDLYYFENVEGGHGAGVTPEQQAESLALWLAYLHQQLGPTRPVS